MVERIESINCFDYSQKIGRYDSIWDFNDNELTYIGYAISTPKVRIDSTPNSFDIPEKESSYIRDYAISYMKDLHEISKEAAVESSKYFLFKYVDGMERYFAYDDLFYLIYRMALRYQPEEKIQPTYTVHRNENYTDNYQVKKKRLFPWGRIFIIVSILICMLAFGVGDSNDKTDPGLEPVAEPLNGAILLGMEVYDGGRLEINASSGNSCVVKLKTTTGIDRMSFYVRAGETAEIGVPPEELYVYFATGSTWYGNKHLFGETTSYSMDDTPIDFARYNITYTLYPVSNGNFSKTPIDPEDF